MTYLLDQPFLSASVDCIRLKKINKHLSGHFFEKQMRQAGRVFLYAFFSPKKMRPLFLFLILSKPNEAPFFFVHFKH